MRLCRKMGHLICRGCLSTLARALKLPGCFRIWFHPFSRIAKVLCKAKHHNAGAFDHARHGEPGWNPRDCRGCREGSDQYDNMTILICLTPLRHLGKQPASTIWLAEKFGTRGAETTQHHDLQLPRSFAHEMLQRKPGFVSIVVLGNGLILTAFRKILGRNLP